MKIIKNFFESGLKRCYALKLGSFNIINHRPLHASCYLRLKSDTDYSNSKRALGSNKYIRSIVMNSPLYQDIQFNENLLWENANSGNELVITLRDLNENKVSADAIDESVYEKFKNINFTLLDLIEIFHILQNQRILSDLKKQVQFWKLLSYKCYSIVGEKTSSRLLVLMILISEIRRCIPKILPFTVLHRFNKLTRAELVGLFYTLKFQRVSIMPEVKYNFWEHVTEALKCMNNEEMAIIAHGSFRSEFKMSKKVGKIMLTRLEENIENMHPYVACEISKYIKYLGHKWDSELVLRFQEKVKSVSHRFNSTTLSHLASIRNNENSVSNELIDILRDRIMNEEKPRMKEVERFLLLRLYECTKIEDPEFIEFVIEKILKDKEQIVQFPRSFVSLMQYLVYLNIYQEDLIDYTFSEDFLQTLYEKVPYYKGHELCSIDCNVELERPNYGGNRLPTHKRDSMLKKNYHQILNGFVHNFHYKVKHLLNEIIGTDYAMLINGLPHLPCLYPVIRLSKDYEPLSIDDLHLQSRSGKLIKFHEDIWLIFPFISRGYRPDGVNVNLLTQAKLRLLRAVGFITVEINLDFPTWNEMTNEAQKEYLCGRIIEALKTKPPMLDTWLVQNQSIGSNCQISEKKESII